MQQHSQWPQVCVDLSRSACIFLCVCKRACVCVKLTEGMGEDHGRVEESDLGVFVCAHIF